MAALWELSRWRKQGSVVLDWAEVPAQYAHGVRLELMRLRLLQVWLHRVRVQPAGSRSPWHLTSIYAALHKLLAVHSKGRPVTAAGGYEQSSTCVHKALPG